MEYGTFKELSALRPHPSCSWLSLIFPMSAVARLRAGKAFQSETHHVEVHEKFTVSFSAYKGGNLWQKHRDDVLYSDADIHADRVSPPPTHILEEPPPDNRDIIYDLNLAKTGSLLRRWLPRILRALRRTPMRSIWRWESAAFSERRHAEKNFPLPTSEAWEIFRRLHTN